MPSDDPIRRLDESLENAAAIGQYTAGYDLSAFTADRKTIDAVERCLERISEASRGLGQDIESLAPHQPWRQIKDLGNALRHAYHKIKMTEIWQIVTTDLPALEHDCRRILDQLRQQGSTP